MPPPHERSPNARQPPNLRRKADHGRADALLIAAWALGATLPRALAATLRRSRDVYPDLAAFLAAHPGVGLAWGAPRPPLPYDAYGGMLAPEADADEHVSGEGGGAGGVRRSVGAGISIGSMPVRMCSALCVVLGWGWLHRVFCIGAFGSTATMKRNAHVRQRTTKACGFNVNCALCDDALGGVQVEAAHAKHERKEAAREARRKQAEEKKAKSSTRTRKTKDSSEGSSGGSPGTKRRKKAADLGVDIETNAGSGEAAGGADAGGKSEAEQQEGSAAPAAGRRVRRTRGRSAAVAAELTADAGGAISADGEDGEAPVAAAPKRKTRTAKKAKSSVQSQGEVDVAPALE